jgi:hypothetical protein
MADGMKNLRNLQELQTQETVLGPYMMRELVVDLPGPVASRRRNKPVICSKPQRLYVSKCEMLKGGDLVAAVRGRNALNSPTLQSQSCSSSSTRK